MDIFVMNKPEGLIPMYDSDAENMSMLKLNHIYRVKVTQPRNLKFHKKFFALLRLTVDNLPERFNINNVDDFLVALKYDLGFCNVYDIEGNTILIPKSISFSKMDEKEFESFFDMALRVILTKYLAGTDEDELREEIERYK